MATYVLIHGAGDRGWYWHLVASELRERGNEVLAPDLPCDDESAGLSDYADTVLDAIGERTDLVVVAQSFGAFTGAARFAASVPVELLGLVAGIVPRPGETGDAWWANTGYEDATRERQGEDEGELALFDHDVESDLAAEAMAHGRPQSATPTREPWPLDAWPGRADEVSPVPGRPSAAGHLDSRRRSAAAGNQSRRDRRRPLRRPQPAEGARRSPRGVPGRYSPKTLMIIRFGRRPSNSQ